MQLSPGQNTPVAGPTAIASVDGAVDLTALVLSANGKVGGDADMIFFNQPDGPGMHLAGSQLTVEFARLRSGAEKVVLVASPADEGRTFGEIPAPQLTVSTPSGEVATFTPPGLSSETALILAEIYAHNGAWKVRAVGQGYASGLAGIATDFGIEVDDEPAGPPAPPAPHAPPAPPPGAPISLEKARLVNLEKKLESANPQMLSLVKQAGVSLEKKGLGEHTARVALCLDISASMMRVFMDGAVQRLIERVLALGLRFDDDGEVDVFLFGREAHRAPSISLNSLPGYTSSLLHQFPLEGGTHYGKALRLVREEYFGTADKRKKALTSDLPVYLMFITDGVTMDKDETITQVRSASHEAMFIQFMGIGPHSSAFGFLQKLDDLRGRLVDNADFFSVTEDQLLGSRPISDDELFNLMMTEYPGWLPQARQHGLLR